jgi:hypothetical protein
MSDWYRLDDKQDPVRIPFEELLFRKDTWRLVARTTVYDGCEVSTVFLGLDHALIPGDGSPIVFETMVFGGPFDQEQERYCTWADAEAGHARWVEKCQPIMTEDAR